MFVLLWCTNDDDDYEQLLYIDNRSNTNDFVKLPIYAT